jgi:hypothetical protein
MRTIVLEETMCEQKIVNQCSPKLDATKKISIEFVDTLEFDRYRLQRLGSLKHPQDIIPDDTDTAILTIDHTRCDSIKHIHMGITRDGLCFALAYSNIDSNYSINVGRYESEVDEYGLSKINPDPSQMDEFFTRYSLNAYNLGKVNPTGFFRKVPKTAGRLRLRENLGSFFRHFEEIQLQLSTKLNENNIVAGDDIIAMVLNEGELDIFLNFACSCRLHNLDLSKILVFAAGKFVLF